MKQTIQIHLIWYDFDGKRDKCENETWHRFIAPHLSQPEHQSNYLSLSHSCWAATFCQPCEQRIYNIVMDTVCGATIELTIQFDSV